MMAGGFWGLPKRALRRRSRIHSQLCYHYTMGHRVRKQVGFCILFIGEMSISEPCRRVRPRPPETKWHL